MPWWDTCIRYVLNKKRAPIRKCQTIKSGKRHFGKKTHVYFESLISNCSCFLSTTDRYVKECQGSLSHEVTNTESLFRRWWLPIEQPRFSVDVCVQHLYVSYACWFTYSITLFVLVYKDYRHTRSYTCIPLYTCGKTWTHICILPSGMRHT